jgi:predicted RNase H-like HicB family nuclease
METLDLPTDRRGTPVQATHPEFRAFDGGTFECRAIICAEKTGGFSVYALRLPGVVSQGATEEEAIANITEAFGLAIESYRELQMPIPWTNERSPDIPEEGKVVWTLVTV